MYLPEWVQKFKEPKTEIKIIKKRYYKYSVEYKYNPVKKRTDKITTHLLGRIDEKDGFVPSDKNKLRTNLADKKKTIDIKTYGVYRLFTTLLNEEMNSIKKLIPQTEFNGLISISMMRFAYQCPLKRIPFLYEHDFISQELAITINNKVINETLKYVGENRVIFTNWMKKRIENTELSDSEFVMIDSTHIVSHSKNLNINAKGYNPDHNFDEQMRLMYIFSQKMHQPVYYRLVNGNITDVSSMKLCVDELSLKKLTFIADKGFYSKKNIDYLIENQLNYIIPLHRNNNLIDFKPIQQENFKVKLKTYFIYQKRVIWYYTYENQGQTLVTFLDETLKVKEENDYLLRVDSETENYSQDKFYEKISALGTLTITYKLLKELTPEEIYKIYKQRNEIEVMFDVFKNVLKSDKTYMQNRYVLEGWLMANFLAMIVYYKMYILLKNNKKLKIYSPSDIIQFAKRIYKTKINEEWHISELTKKHADLFKTLGIDYLK